MGSESLQIFYYAFRTNVTDKVKDVMIVMSHCYSHCHSCTSPVLPSFTSLPSFSFFSLCLEPMNPRHAERQSGCVFVFSFFFLWIFLLRLATWWSYTRIWECQWSLFIIYFLFLISFLLYITSSLGSPHQAYLFPISITSNSSLQPFGMRIYEDPFDPLPVHVCLIFRLFLAITEKTWHHEKELLFFLGEEEEMEDRP